MSILIIALALALGLATVGAFWAGRRTGFDLGVNTEWCRNEMARLKAESDRHGPDGQFRRVGNN